MRVAVITALLVIGCKDNVADLDMGVADLAMPDVGAPADLSTPVVVNGTRLLEGQLVLFGITDDDWAVAGDSNGVTQVVPIAGGAAELVEPKIGAVRVSGKAVFTWGSLDSVGIGAFRVWTDAHKLQTLATVSTAPVVGISGDGEWVMFTDNSVGITHVADLFVARTDGSGKQMVVSERRAIEPCRPRIVGAGSKLVVAHCRSAGDAGANPALVSLVDPATGTVTTLASSARPFVAVDKAGTRVLVLDDASGALSMITLAGGAAQVIEPSPVADAFFNSAGSDVFYVTRAGALRRTPVPALAPITLGGSGVRAIDAFSANEQWIAYHRNKVTQTGIQDLYLASATTAGAPTVIAAGKVAIYGDVFTADSSRVLYYTDLDSGQAGTLNVHPVNGDPERVISNDKAWTSFTTAGSNVVFNDHWRLVMSAGRANLRITDNSDGGSSLIAVQADQAVRLNAARNRLLYTYRVDPSKAGLYVIGAD